MIKKEKYSAAILVIGDEIYLEELKILIQII
jgi:hypothetical protein